MLVGNGHLPNTLYWFIFKIKSNKTSKKSSIYLFQSCGHSLGKNLGCLIYQNLSQTLHFIFLICKMEIKALLSWGLLWKVNKTRVKCLANNKCLWFKNNSCLPLAPQEKPKHYLNPGKRDYSNTKLSFIFPLFWLKDLPETNALVYQNLLNINAHCNGHFYGFVFLGWNLLWVILTQNSDRTDSPEMDPHKYGPLIAAKGVKALQRRKDFLVNEYGRNSWASACKKQKGL